MKQCRTRPDLGTWLKRERLNRVRYRTRDEARADLLEYIEVFYNRKRRHGYIGNVSPADFEKRSVGSFETVHKIEQDEEAAIDHPKPTGGFVRNSDIGVQKLATL